MSSFKNILTDLYYRIISFPLLFQLWMIILWWQYRIGQQRYKFFKTRAALDHVWLSSERLPGRKREKQEKKLRKLEKDFLAAEEDLKKYEEECLIKKSFLTATGRKYLTRISVKTENQMVKPNYLPPKLKNAGGSLCDPPVVDSSIFFNLCWDGDDTCHLQTGAD